MAGIPIVEPKSRPEVPPADVGQLLARKDVMFFDRPYLHVQFLHRHLHMYIYIYIYFHSVYIYIFTYVHVYVYMYMYIYTVYIYIYV